MVNAFKAESDLAKVVVEYLREQGWEVYQEVKLKGSGVADIVAVQGQIVWVIESKMSLGFAVLEQAWKWQRYAHYVSVAVPVGYGKVKGRQLANQMMRSLGIGHLEVSPGWVRVYAPPSLNRRAAAKALRDSLNEKHKTYAQAGNADGRHWSPFKQTCDDIRVAVATSPGITMKDLLERITTHYRSLATARSSIVFWARHGKIKGVEVRREGRRLTLHPTPTP